MSSSFSVLCSLYYKEKPQYLEECFKSLSWQELLADEIVVVHDGPLTNELYAVLKQWKNVLPIKEVILEKNVGLGNALNIGLNHCKHNLIVRVDTDDINHPERFIEQVKYMDTKQDIVAASSDVYEFNDDFQKPICVKRVPQQESIYKYSLYRNPFNHMATIFRKDVILSVGGYKHLLFMEDYYLWLRLQAEGYALGNINHPLVSARVGNGMIERRKGIKYVKSELFLMFNIYNLKLSRNPMVFFYFIVRSITRILPANLLKLIYLKTLR
ncbi:glycosyltransferase [Vibrio navarrensis]|uniref:glycosyltransferase n=2 Tax=Vibrio navarrensis TaxID=29495 RepID=UPI001558818A|nr:glycosyltransferase [Vibrio navarrensis]